MILIADVGGSKGDWCLVDKNKVVKYKTSGFNPYVSSEIDFYKTINSLKNKFDFKKVKKIFYYGAGCKNKYEINLLNKSLSQIFLNSIISVESDLLGACRATCFNNSGIVSILGTGSNSCYYNGKKIVKKISR